MCVRLDALAHVGGPTPGTSCQIRLLAPPCSCLSWYGSSWLQGERVHAGGATWLCHSKLVGPLPSVTMQVCSTVTGLDVFAGMLEARHGMVFVPGTHTQPGCVLVSLSMPLCRVRWRQAHQLRPGHLAVLPPHLRAASCMPPPPCALASKHRQKSCVRTWFAAVLTGLVQCTQTSCRVAAATSAAAARRVTATSTNVQSPATPDP